MSNIAGKNRRNTMSNSIDVPAVAEPSKEQSDEATKEELDEAGDLPSPKISGKELLEPHQKGSKQEIIEVPAVAEPSKEQSDEAAKEELDEAAGDLPSAKRSAGRDLELGEPSQKKSKQEEIIEVPAVTEPSKEQSDEATKEELDEAAGNDLPSHGTSSFQTSKQEEITLYHYTTKEGAEGIRRDMKVLQSPPNLGHRMHGEGVCFTSLHPSSDYEGLIKNNFAKRRSPIRNYNRFYNRIRHVVEITFYKNEVVKIYDGARDLYMHRGDVDLNNYRDKHKIYKNRFIPMDL